MERNPVSASKRVARASSPVWHMGKMPMPLFRLRRPHVCGSILGAIRCLPSHERMVPVKQPEPSRPEPQRGNPIEKVRERLARQTEQLSQARAEAGLDAPETEPARARGRINLRQWIIFAAFALI